MAPPVGLGGFPLRSAWLSAGRSSRNKNLLLRKSPGQSPEVSVLFKDFFFVPWADQYNNYTTTTYDSVTTKTYHDGPRLVTLNSYTLTATQQTYSVSGVSSILKAGRRITGTLQTYSVTPVSANLGAGRKLIGTQQTYSASGVNSILKAARQLLSTQQTYSVSTLTAGLKADFKLIGTQQSYAVTTYPSIFTYAAPGRVTKVLIIT